MADNDIELRIGVDTKDAEKSLEKFKNNSSNSLSLIEKSFSGLKTAATAAVAVFAAKNVFDFFKEGISAAADTEVSFAKMTKALELSGNAAPGVADTFDKLANNIERITGISGGAIQEQISLAQSFGLTNAETQKLIIAATELSSATGESLDTSVRNLGNTFNGTIGALKKTVPELSKLDEKALKAGKALDFVVERFGGTAAKKLETFAGATEQVGIAFGKIPEAFGETVVKNEALAKALETITNTFYGLAEIVKDNQTGISNLVTFAIDPLMGALSAAVRIVGFFNNAINGIQLSVLSLGKVFLDAASFAADFGVTVAKLTFGGKQYKEAKKAADAAKQSADEYTKALQLMNDQVIKEKNDFSKLNDNILNYKTITSDSIKKIEALAIAEAKARKEREKTSREIEELQKSYKTFYDKMLSGAVDSLDGQLDAYESYMDEVDRLNQSGIFSSEKINKLKETVVRNHEEKITQIVKKLTEERKKEVDEIIKDSSFSATVKLVLDKNSAADVKKAAKTAFGTILADFGGSVISAVTQGEKGFSNLVANLVKAIPVFGNLIAAAVELGTLSPEENKKAIEGFAGGIEKSMENFNTNLGALPSILSGVAGPLIEKILGPLFTSFVTNLMKSLRDWPNLVGVIAQGVAKGLQAQGGIMAEAFKVGIADTKAELGRFAENTRNFFSTFGKQLVVAFRYVFSNNPLLNELKSMKAGIIRLNLVIGFMSTAIQTIPVALMEIRDLFNGMIEQFASAFTNLGSKFTDGFLQVRDQLVNLFSGIETAIGNLPGQIKDAFSDLYDGIKNAITEVFSDFMSKVGNFVDKFVGSKGIESSVGGGGGGDLLSQITPSAKGLTEVPRGYENDTFLSRLSSGERVVDSNTNGDLKKFLSEAQSGGLNSGEAIALLRQIAARSGGPSVVEVTVDKKVLGRAVLDLNRRNERING